MYKVVSYFMLICYVICLLLCLLYVLSPIVYFFVIKKKIIWNRVVYLYCTEIGYLDRKGFTFEILFCNDYEKIPSRLLITVYKDIYP